MEIDRSIAGLEAMLDYVVESTETPPESQEEPEEGTDTPEGS